MTRRYIENLNINKDLLDVNLWPTANILTLNEEQQDLFSMREKAILLYIVDNVSLSEIENQTGICPSTLRRLIKRCFMQDSFGQIWGYRALIPQKRVKTYVRKKSISSKSNNNKTLQGAFNFLLQEYPEINELIINLYLNRDKKSRDVPSLTAADIHSKFITACRNKGIKSTEYPLNTYDLARRSLYRYLTKIHDAYFVEASSRYGEEVQRNIILSQNNSQPTNFPVRPFEQVQFDGHQIDGIFVIKIKTPEGDEEILELSRIWILTIIDVATRTILGYRLCLNSEYSAEDVLHCIKNAVVPKKLIDFSVPGLKYPEKIGFHSAYIKETEWAVWNELYFDNAKANLANMVRPRLTKTIKCAVNAGPVKVPKRRVLVERFFGLLEEYGYHKLPSTTGNGKNDVRRNNPAEKAKKYNITYEQIYELTEALISYYNLCPHSALNYKSPLECMEHRVVERNMLPRYLEENNRHNLSLLSLYTQRTVSGDKKNGKRPYIYYEGVEYHNEVLSRTPELIGQTLDLVVNIDDLRSIKAYLPDGGELGVLTANRKWSISPHSLKIRKEINKLKNRKIIYFTSFDNPVQVYNDYLLRNAKTDKRSRNRLAALNQSNRDRDKDKEDEVEKTKVNSHDSYLETNGNTFSENSTNKISKRPKSIESDTDDLNNNRDIFKTFTY